MKKIFKYKLDTNKLYNEISMPKGAKILCSKFIRGKICIYALVETINIIGHKNGSELRTFVTIFTGDEVKQECSLKYLNTIEDKNYLVWHVFEKIGGAPNE